MKAIINIDLPKKQKDGKPEIDAFIWTEDREPPPLIRPRVKKLEKELGKENREEKN